MLSKIYSSGILGIDSYTVEVEVDVASGLPMFNIVGMADLSISESKHRVKAALKNSGYGMSPKKVVVNLSPAGIKKEGAHFDLPIAVGIMKAMEYLEDSDILTEFAFIGELSLGGEVRKTKGVINATISAKEKGLKGIVVPYDNYYEGTLISGIEIVPVRNLKDVYRYIVDGKKVEVEDEKKKKIERKTLDFKDVKGQEQGKRALEISAAGGHNILMIGSPGSGKSMMSKRLPSIMPRLSEEEKIELTKIYSSSGLLGKNHYIVEERPFRSPHHTSSSVALIGGGRVPKVGEITLAHRGVLFLDEGTEYKKDVIEALRQPLEDRKVLITRANYKVELPCDFILLIACNPCPCGLQFEGRCSCSDHQVKNFRRRLSGPILDRMDLYIEIKRLKKEELFSYGDGESSKDIGRRVERARIIQGERYNGSKLNGQMTQGDIKKYCKLDEESKKIVEGAIDRFSLSARGYDKLLKVARTIADLDGSSSIRRNHILEALSYRESRG